MTEPGPSPTGGDALAFYSTPGPMTRLEELEPRAAQLPNNIGELILALRGAVLDPYAGPEPPAPSVAAPLARGTAGAMLTEVLAVRGTAGARRVALSSRDTAVLLCAVLRARGEPSRARCGFLAVGSEGERRVPLWLCEHHPADADGWVLLDARGTEGDDGRPAVFPDERFIRSARAWEQVRLRTDDPRRYGFGRHTGVGFVRGQLLRDLLALVKVELPAADPRIRLLTGASIVPEEMAWLDEVAGALHGDVAPPERLESLVLQASWLADALRDELHQAGLRVARREYLSAHSGPLARRLVGEPDRPVENPVRLFLPRRAQPPVASETIVVRGASQNNLKGVDVDIPHHRLVVVTGVSGSGKSSLVFDTIYAESRRRYLEAFSAFGRQFMEKVARPRVQYLGGLSPAVAIEQKTLGRNPRSNVGTVTEISDYLRLLFSRIGLRHDAAGQPMPRFSSGQIAARLAALPPGSRFEVRTPLIHPGGALLVRAADLGVGEALRDGRRISLGEVSEGEGVELVTGGFNIPEPGAAAAVRERISAAVRAGLSLGDGVMCVVLDEGERVYLGTQPVSPTTGERAPELTSQHFSRNSPFGMCEECRGLGYVMRVDPGMLIADPAVSILDGALSWYGRMRSGRRSWWPLPMEVLVRHYGADLETAWRELPEPFRRAIIEGTGDERIRLGSGGQDRALRGLAGEIERLFHESASPASRAKYASYMARSLCGSCRGSGLHPRARSVTVGGSSIAEVSALAVDALAEWVERLGRTLDDDAFSVGEEALIEIHARACAVARVGLGYLTLSRAVTTLSGGEGQRLRLAAQLNAGLTGVLYVLDEPTVGLHPRDEQNLLETLHSLRAQGNSVLVVEHDATMMRHADWLIDVGPGAGAHGGRILAAGSPDQVAEDPRSVTGPYLRAAPPAIGTVRPRRPLDGAWITLAGARLHNLKAVQLRIPVARMTCVTGVSGSGKSNLVARTLQPALERALAGALTRPGPYDSLAGVEHLTEAVSITQAPIGRTPRSNPATFLGFFDNIRAIFGRQPEARRRGLGAGAFSFNTEGGRCPTCSGHGQLRVEMHFLADVWVKCPDCHGARYGPEVLAVRYRGHNIHEVLEMEVEEAGCFFADQPRIAQPLATLGEVGLGYLHLGQSATTLSGGEAQRLKIARELGRTRSEAVLYTLDEPTTGLHFEDIRTLLKVLDRLVDQGHTVVVIEHNPDVIAHCDWVIDMGPGGGEAGGRVVAEGPPEEVARAPESVTGPFLAEALARRAASR